MLQRNHLYAAHGSGIAGGITHTLPRRADAVVHVGVEFDAVERNLGRWLVREGKE